MEKKFLICALQAEFLAILGLVLLMTLFWALPVEAGVSQRCARLVPTGGREVIINECATCRIVNIIRKRPGNSAPFTRSYNVQPNTTFPVPFRGPGRSRVTSVRACKGGIGAAENLLDKNPKKKAAATCVDLKRNKAGAIVLANSCAACKAALIERTGGRIAKAKRQAYKIGPLSATEVPQLGASKVGLVGTIDCPK